MLLSGDDLKPPLVRAPARTAVAGLSLILTAWLWWVLSLPSPATFGQYHDDTILMSSAKALAEGRGFIMPSVPGTPAQTKYPILYPWLLSRVWKWNPNFPQNVETGLKLSAAFGCLAILACYWLCRNLGMPAAVALLLTAACAFQPIFLVLSTKLLTDVPMMALTLLAAMVAERALADGAPGWLALGAGALAAAATLTRTIGATVIVAVALVGLYRRRYRQTLLFVVACLPLVAVGPSRAAARPELEAWVRQGGPGFQNNWLYYTSYLQFWELSVSSPAAFGALVRDNLFMFLITPAMYFEFPPVGGLYLYLYMAGSAAIVAGIVRSARRYGWRVIHFAFLIHTLIILSWTNREMVERFFLPFLPLFAVGLWTEGSHIGRMLWEAIQPSKTLAARALAAGVALALGLVMARGVAAAWTYNRSHVARFLPGMAALWTERREAFDWAKRNTAVGTRFITWDDASLYLYTGRQAMRPLTFSTKYYYDRDPRLLDAEVREAFDTARQIGASYWIRVDGEFADGQIERRIEQVVQPLPVVFKSDGGRARIYDLAPIYGEGKR